MVEQFEMMNSAEPAARLRGERDALASAAPAMRAGRLDEQVANHGTDRATGIARDRGADRVVVRPGEQRSVVPMIAQAAVLITARPVVGEQVTVPQILDARTRSVDQGHERPCFCDLAQSPACEPGRAGQRGTKVGRTEVKDVAYWPRPRHRLLRPVVTSAANDQAAHGVAYQQDLLHLRWPRSGQAVEQASQVLAVIRHVPACAV